MEEEIIVSSSSASSSSSTSSSPVSEPCYLHQTDDEDDEDGLEEDEDENEDKKGTGKVDHLQEGFPSNADSHEQGETGQQRVINQGTEDSINLHGTMGSSVANQGQCSSDQIKGSFVTINSLSQGEKIPVKVKPIEVHHETREPGRSKKMKIPAGDDNNNVNDHYAPGADQRSVKIKVNDLTPSSSQEFLSPPLGGGGGGRRRRSPSLASSLSGSSPLVSPSTSPSVSPLASPVSQHRPIPMSPSEVIIKVPPVPSPTNPSGSTPFTPSVQVTSNIGGTTAKRCAKRNSNSSLPGFGDSNHHIGNSKHKHNSSNKENFDSIHRRKSWSSAIDQLEINQNKFTDPVNRGNGTHRIRVSSSSLDSDFEDTFYDAQEVGSPRESFKAQELSQQQQQEQAPSNEKNNNSLGNNHNSNNITSPLTRYASVSASKLDEINMETNPDCPFDPHPTSRIGIAISNQDLASDSLSPSINESQSGISTSLLYDKPRSLSASSSETIFIVKPHFTPASSISNSSRIQISPIMASGCARSLSDIVKPRKERHSLIHFPSSPMRSESASSSRENISLKSNQGLIGNITNNDMTTIPTPPIATQSTSDSTFISNCKNFLTSTTSRMIPTSVTMRVSSSSQHQHHRHSTHVNQPQAHYHQYLTPPRSNLHKSISTPSILAAQEAAEEREPKDKNLSYISNQESDDEKSISKRKKRGSLFFRKKRKDVKKVSPHQFVSVCYSIAALCDVCKKALANKPAIKCENCMVTVHDNSCKDQILDCNKFRLAKKPSHLALSTKDRTISPMLQVPPGRLHYHPLRGFPSLSEYPDMEEFPIPLSIGSSGKSTSPTSSIKEKKLAVGFTKNHQSSSHSLSTPHDSSGITCKPPLSSSPSKVICEDKELDTGEDGHSNIVETNSGSMESLDEGVAEIITSEFEDDSILRLLDDEPESWNNTVDKKVLKRLKEKDIKRQEVIHELIITEKHHCLTLKIMQKIYAQGMIQELNLTKDMVERIFPCLEDLLETHLTFLKKLRERQSIDSVIDNIGDIILQQFSGSNGEQLKNCYGQFCSQHKEALSLYKDILKTDRKFQSFIKKCSLKPLCKTRGIPECILLVTQRITKYPLLIDSLLKVTKDTKCDYSDLKDALRHIKNVINRVDSQVAEKEKEIRLLEIYNKIDAKSTTLYRGKKFRKSDLLSNNRKLRYEANLSWKSVRGKVVDVIGVIISDVIILLQENNQKYHFCSLDNKSSVVSLQKLLVREKAGQSSRGVYLISSDPHEPEMYELVCPTAKDQKHLIDQIRESVEMCPDEEDEGGPGSSNGLSEVEERKIEEARKAKVRELLNSMYEKDARMAQMCEDKMKIFADMMELLGIEQEGLELIRYVPIIEDNCSPETIINAANEAFRIAHNLYISGTNLCRSVSSAGEHQSDTFVSPILPKRAETFGGFDNPEKDAALRLNALKKKLIQLKDVTFKETDRLSVSVTGDRASSSGIGSGKITEAESDGSGLNNIGTSSLSSSVSSTTSTTLTNNSNNNTNPSNSCNPAGINEPFLAIKPTICEIRRSSGPLIGGAPGSNPNHSKSCSSSTSSPEKGQRRSLVTTPTPSIQSLFTSSSNTLAPTSPASSSSMFTPLPLYDPSDIYRLTTTPLLMTQGKDQLIQIAELQHQVNLLMCLFNYQQTLFENMRFQLMDSNNKIVQLQKDNIYSSHGSISGMSGSGKEFGYSTSGGSSMVTSSISSGGTLGTSGTSNSVNNGGLTVANMNPSGGGSNTGIGGKPDRRSVYRPEQGLEELRNLQEQLRIEKSDWMKKLNLEKSQIETERKSLEELQESVRKEQKDVEEQRELLYRKLEALQKEGIVLSPALTIVNTSSLRHHSDQRSTVSSGGGNGSGIGYSSPNNHHSAGSVGGGESSEDNIRMAPSINTQMTRSIGLNNISSSTSSTPLTNLPDKLNCNQSSSSSSSNYAFPNNNNTNSASGAAVNTSAPIKQQLPLKLAVNEPGQGRCNSNNNHPHHSQVTNSPSQQLPAPIGNIPVSKVFLAQF